MACICSPRNFISRGTDWQWERTGGRNEDGKNAKGNFEFESHVDEERRGQPGEQPDQLLGFIGWHMRGLPTGGIVQWSCASHGYHVSACFIMIGCATTY